MMADIYNGNRPGNFGWLTWAGSPNVPTLVASLTPTGNSSTYINPDNKSDRTVSIGDWVQGSPGVSNSRQVRGFFRPQRASAPEPGKRLSAKAAVAAALVTLLFVFLLLPFVLQIRVTTSSGFKFVIQVHVVDGQENRPVAKARVAATFDPKIPLPLSEWAITDADGRCQVTAHLAGSTRTTRFSRSGNPSARGWLVFSADGFETDCRRLSALFGETVEWKGSPPGFACTVTLSRDKRQ